MATPRDIRRLAFQGLFQLDIRGEHESESIRQSLAHSREDDPVEFTDKEIDKAFALAVDAFRARREADEAAAELAPTWPAYRQPPVDRAILRLAHYEMKSGRTNPKIAVNEAVELAKRFSTDRSPAFVNAVLDKVLKSVLAGSEPIDHGETQSAEGEKNWKMESGNEAGQSQE